MIYEAVLCSGPAHGETYELQDVKREIVIARLSRPVPFYLEPDEDPFEPVPIERHHYFPTRAVIYYRHEGVR